MKQTESESDYKFITPSNNFFITYLAFKVDVELGTYVRNPRFNFT